MRIRKLNIIVLIIPLGILLFCLIDKDRTFAQTIPLKKKTIEQLVGKEYEYDINSVVYIEKGEKEPKLLKINDEEDQYLSSNVLREKNSDRLINYSKFDRFRAKLNELKTDPEIEYFQPVYLYSAESWTRSGGNDTPGDFDLTPSPATGNHWYYELSNLRKLWQKQDCANSGANCGGSEDVTVAVIDTGLAFEDHESAWDDIGSTNFNFDPMPEMFTGGSINLYTNPDETPNNQIDDDNNGFIDDHNGVNTSNFVNCLFYVCTSAQSAETGHPNDDGGHGTYVTGLISSLVDNSAGSVSPAHTIRIMPIKANYLKSNSFGTLELYYAVEYAVNNGADIINMSLAGSSHDHMLEEVLEEAREAGVLVVVASGNSGGDVMYPAKYDSVLAVGAVKADRTRTSYSSYGPELDLVAYVGNGGGEGNSVFQTSFSCFSAGADCYSSTNTNRYTQFSNKYGIGTSFAAPQVAAWAGIVKSSTPDIDIEELVDYLLLNTEDIGTSGWDGQTGWGVVDYSMGINLPPTITINSPANTGETIDITYDVNWNANDIEEDGRISIYFDTDDSGFDGYLSHFCKDLSEDSSTDNCVSDTRFLNNGTYYIYGCIDDTINEPACDYAAGDILVNHVLQQVESGKLGVTNSLQHVTFSSPFPFVPAVFANEISEFDGQKVLVNIKNVTTTGFDIQLVENTKSKYDIHHPPEIVSWMAILNSDSNKQINLVTLDNNWKTLSLTNGYSEVPKIIAQTQTENGPDIENVDLKDLTADSVTARVEEAPGWDGPHASEVVALMTFINYGGGSQTGKTTGDHNWKSVVFPTSFAEKPILFGEVTSEVGGQMANFDIRNLTKNGFEFRLDEDEFLHDLWHPIETIDWVAIPYIHPVRNTGSIVVHHDAVEVPFTEIHEETPALFTNIVSEYGTDTVTADILWVTEAGFKIRLEEDLYGKWDGIHAKEVIHWLSTKNGISDGIEVGITEINNLWEQIPIQGTYANPSLFVSTQTENGTNTESPDIKKNGNDWFVRVEEDTRLGWDGIHVDEKVAWMVFDTPSIGCWGNKNIDSNGTWQYSINMHTEGTGGNCTFSETPFLFSEINSENGTDSVILDIRNLTNTGFDLRLEEEPNFYDGTHLTEKIVWLAL